MTSIFILELLVNFINSSKPRFLFFLKGDTWIDIITILPPVVEIMLGEGAISSVGFLRILRMFKVLRIFRIFNQLKKLNKDKDQEETGVDDS